MCVTEGAGLFKGFSAWPLWGYGGWREERSTILLEHVNDIKLTKLQLNTNMCDQRHMSFSNQEDAPEKKGGEGHFGILGVENPNVFALYWNNVDGRKTARYKPSKVAQ